MMISTNMLPLFSGYKSSHAQQMALFGSPKTSVGDADTASLALAERVGQSQMLSKSDKTGLMRLMGTVDQFGQGNKDELMQKVAALAGMMEMINNQKGDVFEPFNAADSLSIYWKHQNTNTINDAVRITPEVEIKSLLASLQAQLEN